MNDKKHFDGNDVSENLIGLPHEIEELKTTLSELIYEKDNMITYLVPFLEARYFTLVGTHQLEMMQLEIEYIRLKKKVEQIVDILRSGHQPDVDKINRKIELNLKDWQDNLKLHISKLKKADVVLERLPRPVDKGEIDNLYLYLIRRLHPDVNYQQSDVENSLWIRSYEAYTEFNSVKLKLLLLELHNLPANIVPANIAPVEVVEQMKVITFLKRAIAMQRELIGEIANHFPLTLRGKLYDVTWVDAEKKRITAQADEYYNLISNLITHISNLMPLIEHGKLNLN